MSCLTKPDILSALDSGDLAIMTQNADGDWGFRGRIEDEEPLHVGPNSIDLHLHHELKIYQAGRMRLDLYNAGRDKQDGQLDRLQAIAKLASEGKNLAELDARKPPTTYPLEIPEEGLVLRPGVLYLGRTVERTITPHHVPKIGGRSSTGRLGINIHQTAGFGDVGFDGTWTLELSVVHPVRVYPNMRIAQLWLFTTSSELDAADRYQGRYQGQVEATEYRGHR